MVVCLCYNVSVETMVLLDINVEAGDLGGAGFCDCRVRFKRQRRGVVCVFFMFVHSYVPRYIGWWNIRSW